MIHEILTATWETMLEAAPWLLFGFFIAGIIHLYLPVSWINKLLKKPGLGSIFRASVIGVPIPLCSCGIIPVMKSLRERGVSRGAAASFMTSTPEIGVGAFFLTHGLLGWVFALFRVASAIVSAVIVGMLIESIPEDKFKNQNNNNTKGLKQKTDSSCCSDSSCGHDHEELIYDEGKDKDHSFISRFGSALHFSFYSLPKELSVVLIVGFIISGAFSALLPTEFLTETVTNPILQMLLALLVSLPLYICATSSTPIAAVLYFKGLSAGAVLVFLLAGAATNASSVLAIKKEFGLLGMVYYVGTILVITFLFGCIIEYVIPGNIVPISELSLGEDHHHHGLMETISAMLMLVLLLFPMIYNLKKGFKAAK